MNMEFLRYFVAAAEKGNISQAADSLYISRQALSKSIRHAEKELGVKLVDPASRKFKLTEDGEIVFQNAREILKIWDSALKQIEINKERKITLRVGFGRMSYLVWEEGNEREFMEQNPSVQIDLQQQEGDHLLSLLRNGDLDLAVTSSCPSDETLKFETMIQMPIYAIVHQSDPLSDKSVITPGDITDKPCIFLADDRTGAENFQSLMEQKDLHAKIQFCTDSELPTVFRMIAANRGVFLTSAIFHTLLSPVGCVYIPFETGLPREAYNLDIRLICPKETPLSAAIQSYKNYLLSHVKNELVYSTAPLS